MLELTKKQTTTGLTDLCLTVPAEEADDIMQALHDVMHILGYTLNVDDPDDSVLYSASEVFPNSSPGRRLRGLRTREDITQEEMAERLGLKQHHVSEMENGKRSISIDMAKRISAEFNIAYKVFL